MLTVVELDVVPIDEASNFLVDGQISTILELPWREPRRDGGVGYDIAIWMRDAW